VRLEDRLVGVGEVGERGEEHRDVGGRFAARRPDDEWDVILGPVRTKARRIDATRQGSRNGKREIGLPACIVEIGVVEVDRRVLLGRVLPAPSVARSSRDR
jgi:hypothetical protein